MSDLHSAARLYAENGWAVFPIRPNSKEPLIKEWQKLATTDLDQVDAWWTQWPGANIGFVPESAGLCVVDIDPGANWPYDTDLTAFTAWTPRGGTHAYFAGSLPPSQSKVMPHVDTRGRHSYVLVPPSQVHTPEVPNGEYCWECEWPFHDFDCPDIPDWIVEKCKPKVEDPRKAAEDVEYDKPEALRLAGLWLKLQEQPVEFAGSDGQCYAIAARLLDFGLSPETALDMMTDWSGFEPDWLWEKISHAKKYRQNEEGCDAPTSSQEAFASYQAALGSGEGQEQAANDPSSSRFAWHKPTEYRDRPPITFFDADHMLPNEPRGSVGVIYGPSGHHKTNTLLTMMMQLCEDHDDALILYVAGEGVDGFGRDRVWAHARARGVNDDWIDSHLAIVETMPVLTSVEDMQEFFTAAGDRKPTVVIIDTLGSGTPGVDENSKAMADVLSGNGAAGAIRRHWHCLVICVSHTGKDEAKGLRGNKGQYDNTDFMLSLHKDSENGRAIRLHVDKMRNGDREGRESYYKVEATGIPVPVKITEGEYHDLIKQSHKPDRDETLAQLVLFVLKEKNIVGWEAGLDHAMIAEKIMKNDIGPMPEPGTEGADIWFTEFKELKARLTRAANSVWSQTPKKWAVPLIERRLPHGTTDKASYIVRWRLPPS